jgi:hypothetical protein
VRCCTASRTTWAELTDVLRNRGWDGRLLLGTGTPVTLVVVSGRPYALDRYAGRLAAAIQSSFPGEEGGPALAGVRSGWGVPCGKLPAQVPAHPRRAAVHVAGHIHHALVCWASHGRRGRP